MKTIKGFHEYRKANPELRYGQAFVNYFYETPNPTLFYMEDEEEAIRIGDRLLENWQIYE